MNFFLPFTILSFGLVSYCKHEFYFLHDFEHLSYDPGHVDQSHRRLRRSVLLDSESNNDENEKYVYLKFRSHGREFHLKLSPDSSSFSTNHVSYVNDRPIENADLSFLYHGVDLNDPGSYAYGSLIGGIFDGYIQTSNGSNFYVEKVSRYLGAKKKANFHSIIYSEDQIDYSKLRVKRHLPASTHSVYTAAAACGLNKSMFDGMQKFQQSGASVEETTAISSSPTKAESTISSESEKNRMIRQSQLYEQAEQPWQKYTEQAQHTRTVRNVPQKDARNGLYTVRTCTLYMQADQKLWEYIYNHEGQRSNERTRDEIFALFNNHIKAVNAIYESTDFAGVRGINFNVQRTTIWDNTSCPNSDLEDAKKNPFCEENVDVSNYLNLNSIKNQSDFCLAYAMTYRDFVGGTLGLAWVASPQPSSSGGICEVHKSYSEGGKRVKRSLNTGIITLVNYHNRVPTKVSQLTLAHEIGHNFGSPHDFPSYCQPGLPDGNYIMFASATSGDKPNNSKFSSCSIANISAVLKEVLSQPPNLDIVGAKRNCLIDALSSFCGNGVVEEGEECDCGFDEAECKQRQDSCCIPRTTDGKQNANGCKRMPNADCSPTEGPCCSRQCKFIRENEIICRQASDCSFPKRCNGYQAVCPPSDPKEDKTLCHENTKICHAGNCNRSICELVGMDECFITSGTPEDQCQLSCRKKNVDAAQQCQPSAQVPALKPYYLNRTNMFRGIQLQPGSPCNDYKGYCDIFRKCRSVDSNGPLSRLKNLLFNSETLKTVGDWVQVYWWAVVLMGIGLMLLMALFIKCCAVHTPSTNPRKPPAQSIYETLRHPTTLLRSQGHRHNRDQHDHRHHHHHHQRRSRSHSNNNNNHRHRSGVRHSVTDEQQRISTAGGGGAANGGVNFPLAGGGGQQPSARQSASSVAQVPPIAIEPPPPYTERDQRGGGERVPAMYGGGPPPAAIVGGAGGGPPARGHRKRKHPRDGAGVGGGGPGQSSSSGHQHHRHRTADLVELRTK